MAGVKHFTIVDYFTPWLLAGEVLILVTCLAGDQLLEQISSGVTGATWTKALTDSLTHGLVAFFSWLAVRGEVAPQPLVEMLVCMLMAMAVDSDHFIAARSLNLQVQPFLCNSISSKAKGSNYQSFIHRVKSFCLSTNKFSYW